MFRALMPETISIDSHKLPERVRLPRSSVARHNEGYIQVLRHVDFEAHQALGFEGIFFRPGAVVAWANLRPDVTYPEMPVLLESFLGPVGHNGTRRNRIT